MGGLRRACPRCESTLLPELDEVTGERVHVCVACGERLWEHPAPAYEPPRRPAAHSRTRAAELPAQADGSRRLFDPTQVAAIQAALDAGVPLERVARRFGCAYETIRRIKAGQYG